MEKFQYSSHRGQLGLCVRRPSLIPQLTWSAHPVKYILQIKDYLDCLYSYGVFEATKANVSQPLVLETRIVLHCVQTSGGTSL